MSNNPIETFLNLKKSVTDQIYQIDLSDKPFWQRPFIYVVQIIFAIARDLSDGQLNMRAMSLVYTTLLSLVPLLAICFSVLKGFGVHNQIEPALVNLLAPLGDQSSEITTRVISFVDNIKVGVLGTFGLAVLLYTVISLMTKIERAFNYTWNVSKARHLAARFSDYLSVLLIGPFLIFVSVGLTASIRNAEVFDKLSGIAYLSHAFGGIIALIPFLIMTLAFTFIYMFMPNTRVKFVPAFTAGAATTIMWKILGFVFATVVAGSASYSAIYSAFATLIFFMMWLYFGWLVLLVGASIAYYIQNPSNLMLSRQKLSMSNEMREHLALGILLRVAESLYKDTSRWTVSELAEVLKLPIRVVEDSVDILETQGLMAEQRERPYELVPLKPLDELKLTDAIRAIRSANGGRSFVTSRAQSELKTQDLINDISGAIEAKFGKTTVKDWVLKPVKKTPKKKVKSK